MRLIFIRLCADNRDNGNKSSAVVSAVLSGFLSSGGCTVASNGCAEDSARYTIAIAMLVIPSEVEQSLNSIFEIARYDRNGY